MRYKPRSRSRKRHPWDRGSPLLRWILGVMREVQRPATWRRHPAPFSKTPQGRARRQERRFAEAQREACWS